MNNGLYREWTREEGELLKERYDAGDEIKEIAKFLRRTTGAVRNRLYLLGIASRRRLNDPAFMESVKQLRGEGLVDKQIARRLSCHINTVQNARNRLGLKVNSLSGRPRRKPVIGDPLFLRNVRRLRAKGLVDRQIASQLDCNINTVYVARKRLRLMVYKQGAVYDGRE